MKGWPCRNLSGECFWLSGRGVYIQEVRRVRKEEGTEGVGTHASNLAAVGSRAALTSMYGLAMRGAILDGFCIETQVEKKYRDYTKQMLGKIWSTLRTHREEQKRKKKPFASHGSKLNIIDKLTIFSKCRAQQTISPR